MANSSGLMTLGTDLLHTRRARTPSRARGPSTRDCLDSVRNRRRKMPIIAPGRAAAALCRDRSRQTHSLSKLERQPARKSMDPRDLHELLARVRDGRASRPTRRPSGCATLPYEDLGFAKIDHHRALRRGFPEVVFGAGKTPEQIVAIVGPHRGRAARTCW